MSKKPSLKPVLVVWEDSYNGDHSWNLLSELPKNPSAFKIQTIGFIAAENKTHLQLTMSVSDKAEDGDRQICDLFTIPKGCIKDVRYL